MFTTCKFFRHTLNHIVAIHTMISESQLCECSIRQLHLVSFIPHLSGLDQSSCTILSINPHLIQPHPSLFVVCRWLAVALRSDTGAVSHKQANRDRRAWNGIGCGHTCNWTAADGAGDIGVCLVGMRGHVALQLCGRLTVHPTQLAQQHPPWTGPTADPTLLPLLPVVLLSVDAQVRQRGETYAEQNCSQHTTPLLFGPQTNWSTKLTAVANVADVMLWLVVDPHVVCDVSRGEKFATYVAGDLVLVSDHMSS